MKSVGKPDAGNPHVRFDERGTGNGAIGHASSHRALPRLYKLRRAGVEAVLDVYEGQSHAQYLSDETAPETREVFEEIAAFFDRHLAR